MPDKQTYGELANPIGANEETDGLAVEGMRPSVCPRCQLLIKFANRLDSRSLAAWTDRQAERFSLRPSFSQTPSVRPSVRPRGTNGISGNIINQRRQFNYSRRRRSSILPRLLRIRSRRRGRSLSGPGRPRSCVLRRGGGGGRGDRGRVHAVVVVVQPRVPDRPRVGGGGGGRREGREGRRRELVHRQPVLVQHINCVRPCQVHEL